MIQNPLILVSNLTQQSSYHCFYKIINTKPNIVTGIRLRKFSVGNYNTKTRKCEQAWIEITETNSLNKKAKRSPQSNEKVLIYEKNLTSSTGISSEPGRFCGTLRNFWSNLYSDKKYITINFHKIIGSFGLSSSTNDSFEFEISFYDRESLNPVLHSKQTKYSNNNQQSTNHFDYGGQLENSVCTYYYSNCTNSNSDGCILNSKGYPGIYLRNLKCQYLIKNQLTSKSLINQKLILINDNIQLDGTLCHYQPTGKLSKHAIANTYFCDRGPRKSSECNDYLNIYEGINKYNTKTPNSNILLKNVCGMGRLPKIISKKNGVLLEMETGPNGYFANSGFLFYAMNQKQYFDNYELFNKFNSIEVNTTQELNSLKIIEKQLIEHCNSNMKTCLIGVNDDIINQIYDFNHNENFKIGHLYNLNQYHPENFTLKYLLKTKNFNSIALYIDKYKPLFSTPGSNCENNYLKIETTNQLLTTIKEEDDEDYPFIKSSNDYYETNSSFNYLTYDDVNHNTNLLIKICNPLSDQDSKIGIHGTHSNINPSARFYLIRSSAEMNDMEDENERTKKTNVLISYFNSNQTLIDSSSLFDFKISYEFFNFDWLTYQSNSVCDFTYDLNSDNKLALKGVIQNPQSSIFYKTSDEFLKCKYRFIAKTNYYVKLTIESINFDDENSNDFCQENIFYIDSKSYKNNNQKCSKMTKKIILKELNLGDGSAKLENYEEEDEDEENESHNKGRIVDNKLCLCKTRKNMNYVYISKNNAVEIDYQVKLNKNTYKTKNDFLIKYEFLSRNCNKFLYKNLKSNNKGKLIYYHSNFGIQDELAELKDRKLLKSTSNIDFNLFAPIHSANNKHMRVGNVNVDEISVQENDLLKQILTNNLNFHCKFNIKAPSNSYVHIEISELTLQNECDKNHIKLYSNFSGINTAKIENERPFIRLCDSSHITPNTLKYSTSTFRTKLKNIDYDENKSSLKRNMIVAEFFDEKISNSSFICANNNKICFNTNELDNINTNLIDANENSDIYKHVFHNNLLIEIMSNDLRKFMFEIKYNFYQVKLLKADLSYKEKISEINSWTQYKHNDLGCQFKCHNENDLLDKNITNFYCLDQSLVCDGEVDCISNNKDEINCKFYF